MICSNCAHENRSGARFCANCGTPLAGAVPPPPADVSAEEGASGSFTNGQPADHSDASSVVPSEPAPDAVESAEVSVALEQSGQNGQNGNGDQRATIDDVTAGALPDSGSLASSSARTELPPDAAVDPAEDGSVVISAGTAVTQSGVIGEDGAIEVDASAVDSSVANSSVANSRVADSSPVDASPDRTSAFTPTDVPSSASVQSEGEEAAVEPVAQTGADQASLPWLEPGTLVAERFLVISGSDEPTGREYLVEDRGVCLACGALVTATAEEPYCFECGAYLLDENAQFPTRRLRQLAEGASDADVVTWHDLSFSLLEAESPPTAAPSGASTGVETSSPASFHHGVVLMAGQRSDPGILRAGSPDEDSIFSLTLTAVYESQAQPTIGLYLVADGMGGHGDGEVASRIAVDAIVAGLMQTIVIPLLQGQVFGQETIAALLDAAIVAANRRVYDNARAKGNDMGTTLTLALVIDDQAYIANVGDSRTYLWRQGELQQITEDHSAVYQLVRKGILEPEELYTHPQRNQITRNLGFRPDVQVDYFHQPLGPHDALLLCCDGLWEMLRNEGIADVLLTNFGDAQTVCDALVKRANQAGGEDNISVVLVRIEA